MDGTAHATEQRQLLVEIEAVSNALDKQGDPRKASYEVEQGRKLVEKAVSLGLPEASYARLRDQLAAHDGASVNR